MKKVTVILAVLMIVAFIGSAMAVPPGKKVEYAGGNLGKVVFDGKAHADKGLKCQDCHTKPFAMKKEVKITMPDHNADKYCFTCHNGKKAFATANNCTKCHKK